MSTEENKAVVRRYIEEWNKQNPAGVEELVAPNWVAHGTPPGISPDLTGLKQVFPAFFTAFPDLHFAVEDLLAEGDKVVARLTMRATHQGSFMGIPSTGEQATWTGIEVSRIAKH
jgi:predicted ester cyclase